VSRREVGKVRCAAEGRERSGVGIMRVWFLRGGILAGNDEGKAGSDQRQLIQAGFDDERACGGIPMRFELKPPPSKTEQCNPIFSWWISRATASFRKQRNCRF